MSNFKFNLLCVYISVLFFAFPIAFVSSQEVIEVIDYLPYDIVDVAVSADGAYVAAVNNTHLMVFSVETRSVQWTFNATEAFDQDYIYYLMNISTVKISSNGTYVAIGYSGHGMDSNDGGVSYFNESITKTGEVIEPTWTSWFVKTLGRVDRGCMDISDDGEYVAVAGTGTQIYFFLNCSKIRGEDGIDPGTGSYNWTANWVVPSTSIEELLSIDLTPDGMYMAAGGYFYDGNLTLGYLNRTGDVLWYWYSTGWNGTVWDVAISDDGFSVVAGLSYHTGTPSNTNYGIRYYNNSYNLIGANPSALWWYQTTHASGMNISVAISGSGNEVISGDQYISSYDYWTDAKNRSGFSSSPFSYGTLVYDVSISEDGTIIAAVGGIGSPQLFIEDFGENKSRTIDLNSTAKVLSISQDGEIIATGGEGGSLYLIRYIREPARTQTVGGKINPTVITSSRVVLMIAIILFTSIILLKKNPIPHIPYIKSNLSQSI